MSRLVAQCHVASSVWGVPCLPHCRRASPGPRSLHCSNHCPSCPHRLLALSLKRFPACLCLGRQQRRLGLKAGTCMAPLLASARFLLHPDRCTSQLCERSHVSPRLLTFPSDNLLPSQFPHLINKAKLHYCITLSNHFNSYHRSDLK